jgi:hypothetical protein
MNAIELKAIVNYLIESYCDNVNGDFRHTMKEKSVYFTCTETITGITTLFWYTHTIDAAGCEKQTFEPFLWDGSKMLIDLEGMVNDALDRIYKAELIDNRGDDPAVG